MSPDEGVRPLARNAVLEWNQSLFIQSMNVNRTYIIHTRTKITVPHVHVLCLISDPAGGGSYDYAKGTAGAKYSFTFELRPTQAETRNGFVLHPSYIRPTGEEIWAGVLKMIETMRPL
jgi:hypothetical protein